jgi:hypothetical protein
MSFLNIEKGKIFDLEVILGSPKLQSRHPRRSHNEDDIDAH